MITLPHNIQLALSRLNNAGYSAYIVGGCVRDAIMGLVPNDYDITTCALPNEIMEVFSDFNMVTTGLKHGTVAVIIDHEPVEITTYRIDGEYMDNRHPSKVTFTPKLEEDLSRRDFCMNAIAMSLTGDIVDCFGGTDDIHNKVIRTVGDPVTRFNEDGLRILRGIRFSSVLDFSIDGNTSAAIHKCRDLLWGISKERIRVELFKLLSGKAVERVLTEYEDVIRCFLPINLNIRGISNIPNHIIQRLSYLLMNNTACDITSALCSLKVSNREKQGVLFLCQNAKAVPDLDRIGLKHLMATNPVENIRHLASLTDHMGITHNLTVTVEEIYKNQVYQLSQLAVNGNDLIEIGITGREIKLCLNTLLEAVISGDCENDKKALLTLITERK